MARQQSTSEEQPRRTFSDTPAPSLLPVGETTPTPEEQPAPVLTATQMDPEAAAEIFLACMDMVEQQRFLSFCEGRGLTPAAGMLLFMKEPLQREDLNPLASNAFADDAQAVIDAMQPSLPQEQASPRPQGPRAQLRQKPTAPCAVCGETFIVQFLGRQLCQKESCWHEYAGLHPQRPAGQGARVTAESDRRLGRLEKMVERMSGMLDQLVGV